MTTNFVTRPMTDSELRETRDFIELGTIAPQQMIIQAKRLIESHLLANEKGGKAQAWSDGFTAGWEAGEARRDWQLQDREGRGPIPQQPANPYPAQS